MDQKKFISCKKVPEFLRLELHLIFILPPWKYKFLDEIPSYIPVTKSAVYCTIND